MSADSGDHSRNDWKQSLSWPAALPGLRTAAVVAPVALFLGADPCIFVLERMTAVLKLHHGLEEVYNNIQAVEDPAPTPRPCAGGGFGGFGGGDSGGGGGGGSGGGDGSAAQQLFDLAALDDAADEDEFEDDEEEEYEEDEEEEAEEGGDGEEAAADEARHGLLGSFACASSSSTSALPCHLVLLSADDTLLVLALMFPQPAPGPRSDPCAAFIV